MPQPDLSLLVSEVLQSRKYRSLGIPESTVRDLLEKELAARRSPKAALDAVRRKLHNIMAPYLGDADYPAAARSLDEAFDSGTQAAVRSACEALLTAHASTRERLPLLEEFYNRIFHLTGTPTVILDLACGLNPFAFPWMGLPLTTRYHAYDIHQPRVELINAYFRRQGLEPLASLQDVLVDPPQVEADVAFIFKEAHRMEQRQRGCSLLLWRALRVHYLLVSLPAQSLSGKHNLEQKQRQLVQRITAGEPWRVTEFIVGSEMVFCIEKPPAI